MARNSVPDGREELLAMAEDIADGGASIRAAWPRCWSCYQQGCDSSRQGGRLGVKCRIASRKENPTHMFKAKAIGARAEHQEQQRQRILDSVTLAEKFAKLKSLVVETCHIDPMTGKHAHPVKYTVNLTNAKSEFHIRCPNSECVGGDFDLSEVLRAAVAGKRTKVKGHLTCPGWFSRNTINTRRCAQSLDYQFTLRY